MAHLLRNSGCTRNFAGLYPVPRNPAGRQFDLEELEPRVLLSATVCSPAPAPAAGGLATAVVEEMPAALVSPDSRVVYDCAAQVNDIFTESADTTGTAEAAAHQTNLPQNGDSPAATPVQASTDAQVSPTADANPFPAQLTETLHAANAPPATASGSSAHYTGIRLNGVPFNEADSSDILQIAAGEVLSGTGLVNAPITVSGTISPGNSPGLMQTGSQTWLGGSFPYDWEINHVSGGEGSNPGWDFEKITGSLTITATNVTQATIRVKSLQLNNSPGALFNFNAANTYTWRILSTTNGIAGFKRIQRVGDRCFCPGSFGRWPGPAAALLAGSTQPLFQSACLDVSRTSRFQRQPEFNSTPGRSRFRRCPGDCCPPDQSFHRLDWRGQRRDLDVDQLRLVHNQRH